jgi:hypothetical protein
MIAGQCSCSHYLPPCSRSMIGARYHRRLLTLGDTDLDHNSRPAASTSSGSDFVPSIGLASFRPPHQRQRSSHETKAEPPCEQSVGPSVYLQSYPGNGGKYQSGNPCDDGENDEYAGDQWLNLCSMRTCRRVPLGLVQTVPIYTGLERCRCLTLSGPARGRQSQGRLNWVNPSEARA